MEYGISRVIQDVSKAPYGTVSLPPEQCERMNRKVFGAMRILCAAHSYAEYAAEDLGERLDMIPDGKDRMRKAVADLRAVTNDIVGTMNSNQCRQLLNTMQDLEMRLTPKYTPQSQNVVIERELQQKLIDIAMEKCRDCVEDGRSCRACALYQILEAMTPMEEYSELRCPYAVTEWEKG